MRNARATLVHGHMTESCSGEWHKWKKEEVQHMGQISTQEIKINFSNIYNNNNNLKMRT